MSTEPIGFEQIVAYCLGELDAQGTAAVDARVAGSAELRAMLGRVQLVVGSMRSDDGVMPRREVVDRVKALALPKVSAWWSRAADMVASLVFDSRGQLAVAGFRGATAGRQLSFACDEGEIDLMITEPDARQQAWSIRGQIDAKGDRLPESIALLTTGAEGAIEVAVDQSGQFKLVCGASSFDLCVKFGDRVARLGPVELG